MIHPIYRVEINGLDLLSEFIIDGHNLKKKEHTCRCHRTDEKETRKEIVGTPTQSNKGKQEEMSNYKLKEKG